MKLRKKNIMAMSLGLLSLLSAPLYANSTANEYVVVAPDCLLKNKNFAYESLSQSNGFTLLQTNESGLDQLIAAKDHQKTICGGFMNVTDAWQENKSHLLSAKDQKTFLTTYIQSPKSTQIKAANLSINYPQQVNLLLSSLNPQNMWNTLTTLSNFWDRSASTNTGVQTATWIKNQVDQLTKASGRTDVTVFMINTGSYPQPSVVMKIGTSTQPGVVIGGHMDTLTGRSTRMPGADDDGTGAVTLLETARTLLFSHLSFKKPIYLVWYSAEEVGLVGSQRVVTYFKRQNIPVSGVIQFDMTGYAPNNDLTMWLMTDYTDNELTNFLATLINTYVKRPIQYTACGYACSDHASWTKGGYKACLPAEAAMHKDNPYIHSSQDTMSLLSLTHMTDYAKLAVAFAVEMAEPVV